MRKWWIVAKQVFWKNVKSATYILMTLSPFIFAVIMFLVGWFIFKDMQISDDQSLALVSKTTELSQRIENNITEPHVISYSSIKKAKEDLLQDKLIGVLDLTNEEAPVYYNKTTDKQVNLNAMSQIINDYNLEKLGEKLGISEAQVEKIRQSRISIATSSIDPENKKSFDDSSRVFRIGLTYVLIIMGFMLVVNYSTLISQEVASEKGTRMMEVILSSMSAEEHFCGKLLGILMALGLQLLLYATLSLGGLAMPQLLSLVHQFLPDLTIDSSVWQLLIWDFLFFLFGVLLFVSLATMFGSLVSRAEDAPKALTPITLLMVIGFYIALYAMGNPSSSLVVFGSYFPFFTPFIMPFRLATQSVSLLGITIGFALLILATIIFFIFSAWIYSASALIYSDGNVLKNLLYAIKMRKVYRKKQSKA